MKRLNVSQNHHQRMSDGNVKVKKSSLIPLKHHRGVLNEQLLARVRVK